MLRYFFVLTVLFSLSAFSSAHNDGSYDVYKVRFQNAQVPAERSLPNWLPGTCYDRGSTPTPSLLIVEDHPDYPGKIRVNIWDGGDNGALRVPMPADQTYRNLTVEERAQMRRALDGMASSMGWDAAELKGNALESKTHGCNFGFVDGGNEYLATWDRGMTYCSFPKN